MDKLSEPEFSSNKNWPRLKIGVEEYIQSKEKNKNLIFFGLTAASIFRYYREVTFYKKNTPFFLVAVVPTFIFTSNQMSRFFTHDSHAYAALRNNENEVKYQEEYKQLWRTAKNKNIEIPDDLIR